MFTWFVRCLRQKEDDDNKYRAIHCLTQLCCSSADGVRSSAWVFKLDGSRKCTLELAVHHAVEIMMPEEYFHIFSCTLEDIEYNYRKPGTLHTLKKCINGKLDVSF